MKCDTVRKGVECFFMSAEGCTYIGGSCYPVVEKCEGCERIKDFNGQKFCTSFPEPEAKWSNGACNFATHVKASFDHGQVKINPIKASKRAARGR